MAVQKILSLDTEKIIYRVEIPYKFPSFNEYVRECRKNRYAGAKLKRQVQDDIGYFINQFPRFEHPVCIHFHWIEKNNWRDLDNVCYAKKFILDSLVELNKLTDDSSKFVKSFTDTFAQEQEYKVIIDIVEDQNGKEA